MRHPIRIASALALLCVAAVFAPSATAAPAPSPLEQQWSIVSGPAVKLLVNRTAWTRVGRKQLVAGGLPADTPTKALRLYADGREVPIRVVGATHGVLGRSGALEFYGVAEDTATTDTRIYWLVWSSTSGTGKRVTTTRKRSVRGPVAASFASTSIVAPTDRYYQLNTDPKDDSDHFYGPAIQPGKSATEQIPTVDLAQFGQPVLGVHLQGYSAFDHKVRVTFNGTVVGTVSWSAFGASTARIQLDRNLVHPDTNTVGLEAVGGQLDFSLLDWVNLTYSRQYRAEGNRLTFSLSAGRVARITGFTGSAIRVIDVTRPTSPKLVRARIRHAAGGYTVNVPSATKFRRLVAFATRLTKGPAGVVKNQPSGWYRTGQGADMVIIAYPTFIPALRPLIELRQRQGLHVVVVNVQKLYDEFSFGAHDPDAIRAFLERTRVAWKPVPRYVLLVGDATVDPLNYLKLNDPDFVPTKMIKTYYMRAPSDDWYTDFNDDGVPDMATGRLPVDSAAQTTAVVSKIVRYETTAAAAPRTAFIAADNQGLGFDFDGAATQLASLLDPMLTTQVALRSKSPSDAAYRAQLAQALNSGPSVVSYIGHGGTDRWGGGNFLPPADARTLHNDRLSIYVVTTCLNGYFVEPTRPSLGEDLLEDPQGGAVAMWASSALSDGALDLQLNSDFLRRLYDGGKETLGEKVIAAKRAVQDSEVRRSTVLLGDPASRIQ
jgi:Peptidase family C25